MFKDEYKQAMSFPVSEELLARTRRRMEEEKKPRSRRLSWPVAAAAAVFLLAVGFAGGRLAGWTSGAAFSADYAPEAGTDGAMAAGALSEGAAEDVVSYAYTERSTPQSVTTDAMPVAGALSGVEKETVFYARSPEEALDSVNPWTESAPPAELSVYCNSIFAEGSVDEEAVSSEAREAVDRILPQKALLSSGADETLLEEVSYDMEVDASGEVTLTFEPGEVTVQAESPEEAARSCASADGLLCGVSRRRSEEEVLCTAVFYSGEGAEEEQIYAYNFEQISLEMAEKEGEYTLLSLRFSLGWELDESGSYALISPAEARRRLLLGECQSGRELAVPVEESAVRETELVYWTDPSAEYWQPVYRFLVEVSPAGEDGLCGYGFYYVPACDF